MNETWSECTTCGSKWEEGSDDFTPSPAVKHVAEKVAQSIERGGVMAVNVFGRRRITVVLDEEAAKKFVEEVGL